MLQAFANHLIGTHEVGCGDTLAIRRVRDHDALVLWLCELLEVLLLYADDVGEASSLHVHAGRVHSLHVDVVAIDLMVEVTLQTLVIVDGVEKFSIEVGPFLKGILLTEESGCHILGNEGCLDEQGAATTHRIDKVGVALPSGEQNHTCCQHFVKRCFYAFLTVTATMQRFTTGVETQRTLVVCNMHIQSDVGIGHGDVGALTRLLAELVHDGVLYFI